MLRRSLGTRVTTLPLLSLALSLRCVHRCRRPCDAARAKYALKHTVRTHLGSDDQGYTAMGFGADAEGVQGMYMRKHVIEMAQRGLVENLRRLQPLMTPPAAKVCCRVWCWMWGDGARTWPCWHSAAWMKSKHLQPLLTLIAGHDKVLKATSPCGLHAALSWCYRCSNRQALTCHLEHK